MRSPYWKASPCTTARLRTSNSAWRSWTAALHRLGRSALAGCGYRRRRLARRGQAPRPIPPAAGELALPEPKPGGSLDLLWDFLNVTDEGDFRLAVAWLLAALRPAGPYP